MSFEVTFDDQPYPLPPELVPQSLGLLPSDTGPDKLALFEAVGRLQRDLSRLSGRLQLNIKSQQEGMMKVEEALGGVEARFREQSLIKPPPSPPPTVVQHAGVTLDQLNPHLQKLSEQLITIQRKVNPLAEQLEGVKGSYKDKVEEGQIERILPVLDSFERLFDQASTQSDDPKMQKWLEGVRMIHNQLRSYLRGQGVEEIPALGEVFDPKIFAAVGTDPTDAYEPNRISRVGRTGYRRVTEAGPPKLLRVPEVFVAKPKEEEVRLSESQLTRAELLARQQQEDAVEASPSVTPPSGTADAILGSASIKVAPPVEVLPPPVPKLALPKPVPQKPKAKVEVAPPITIPPKPVPPEVEPPSTPAIDTPPAPVPAPEPTLDPASITVGGGEDKFAGIRAKAEAALKGMFEPEAKVDSAQPTVTDGPRPTASPSTPPAPTPSPMAAWGSIGAEAEVPATPPALPPNEEATMVGAGPALDGGNEEYFADGDAVYELRMETGLTMVAFWVHAFGKQVGDQQLMDLGEAVEREEESIDEKELKKLATGLGVDIEDLKKRFRSG